MDLPDDFGPDHPLFRTMLNVASYPAFLIARHVARIMWGTDEPTMRMLAPGVFEVHVGPTGGLIAIVDEAPIADVAIAAAEESGRIDHYLADLRCPRAVIHGPNRLFTKKGWEFQESRVTRANPLAVRYRVWCALDGPERDLLLLACEHARVRIEQLQVSAARRREQRARRSLAAGRPPRPAPRRRRGPTRSVAFSREAIEQRARTDAGCASWLSSWEQRVQQLVADGLDGHLGTS